MGCSTAYHLASTTDLKIAVLERDPSVLCLQDSCMEEKRKS
jgi:hypothetical protein